MPEPGPTFRPVAAMVAAFRDGGLSPVEVVDDALRRAEAFDGELHAYVELLDDAAREQARDAEQRYRAGGELPGLLGVPVSVKDLFHVAGAVTTLGSLTYRRRAKRDSAAVARLRAAGAVLVGKTNTAEFGQSATTDNLLGPDCGNAWDPARTAGGSSGGAATSVAAGMASVALGSDGGGSIRIPAAFSGLFGMKPTYGLVRDEAFAGMTDFACPGPLARRVADARPMMTALTGQSFDGGSTPDRLRIAWCARPQGRPVEPGVLAAVERAVELLAELGHEVVEAEPPLDGWEEAFGPLVLADEWRERGHLLDGHVQHLTRYARRSIMAGGELTEAAVTDARLALQAARERCARFMERYDAIVTPTTASVAFPHQARPHAIAGERVDPLWGAFPFTAPFNVSGAPAASLPCGVCDGLPVGVQVVAARHRDALVLNLSEQLETALAFPVDEPQRRWAMAAPAPDAEIGYERRGSVAVIRIQRPRRRNALRVATLAALRAALEEQVAAGAGAIVLTGDGGAFSAGIDLDEVGRGAADLAVDKAIDATVRAVGEAPVPVLAAVEGPCIGAGLELAMACDVRVAGAQARFALPAARLGLLYRVPGVEQVLWRVGHQTAARLLLLDEQLDAAEAAATGLVARVVPDGAALDEAVRLGARASACVPEAIASTKRVLSEAASGAVDPARWHEARSRLLASPARLAAVARARDGRDAAKAGLER